MKKDQEQMTLRERKIILKKCHVCDHLNESENEPRRCQKCNKSFLPSNYFTKVHAKNTEEFERLFASSDELQEEDLIRGIYVIW